VSRNGNASGVSSVQYRFVAGTASPDTDFRGHTGTLDWPDGDSTDRTIEFVVESDALSEGDETFKIELFDAVGNDELGINDSVTVAITDSPCSEHIPASMANNFALSAPCYQLNGAATFGPGGQLRISPGTTIIAAAGSAITLTGSYTEIRNTENAVQLRAGAFGLFNNNVLQDTAGAGVILPLTQADSLQAQNTFINTAGGIEIIGSKIDAGQSVALPAQSTHYVLSGGLVIEGTLSLAPGTDLRMGADVPVLVLGNGAVSAVGTANQPINISGVEPRQGFWNGIQYVSAVSSANRFAHATIAHGGGDPARAGNIIIDGLGTTITMQNCALNDSAGYGIVYDSSSFQVELSDISFQGNLSGEQSM